MEERIKFNVSSTFTVATGMIKGILFDVDALKVDGVTPCDIKDLNEVSIDVIQRKVGFDDVILHNGYLEDYLIGLSAQTTAMVQHKTKRNKGYSIGIEFGGVADCSNGGSIVVKVKFGKDSFTDLSLTQSSINIQGIPADDFTPTWLPQVKVFPFTLSSQNFDAVLGDYIFKIVYANDPVNSYDTSTEPSLVSATLSGDSGEARFEKSKDEALFIYENTRMLDANPETDVQHLVLKNTPLLLDNCRAIVKIDAPATIKTKIITVGLVRPN